MKNEKRIEELRAIADELDRRNATWDKIVKADPAVSGSERCKNKHSG